jgi:peptidoglycan/xylan/chitin deacetylase (PgdA/CDA1 family)
MSVEGSVTMGALQEKTPGREPLRRVAARILSSRPPVILAYHSVATGPRSEDPEFLRVHPSRFRQHIEVMLDAGYSFVTVAEFARQICPDGPPRGLAALSFDDGLRDNHAVALPLLREFGVPATVYVTTGLIGGTYPWMDGAIPMMEEEEIRDLAEAGVEIGAHTVTHPNLALLDHAGCLREMSDSRRELERITSRTVETFAYPACHYGDAAVAAAGEAGFLAAVTCGGRGSWDPLTIRRSLITGKDGLPSFIFKVAGFYQPMFDSRAGRITRHATRPVRRGARALIDRRGAA